MSFFSDLFQNQAAPELPEWMRTATAIIDEGLDVYERVADGDAPPVGPMRSQAPPAPSPFAMSGMVALVAVAIGAYLVLGLARRR